ncbi:MAG: hypothetical protein GX777_02305 [Fastidiosipila sp.]|nr:hypothetical protein [Fastidiosipila sp.]
MAGYPLVAGDTHGMSGTGIPEIWSQKLVMALYSALTMTFICNNDYEGEIKAKGDTIKIRTLPHLVIRDYKIRQELEYENPEIGLVDMLINKGKYFGFKANLVETIQSDIEFVDKFLSGAGLDLKVSIEKDFYQSLWAEAALENSGADAGAKSGDINLGTAANPLSVDKDNIIDIIGNCEVVLDEQDIPTTGRWMILPSWATNKIKTSELKDAGLTGDKQTMIRTGLIGNLFGFDIFKSNNLLIDTGAKGKYTHVIAGHKQSTGFATQLATTETIADPKDFGKLVRALQVYGWKTIQPEGLIDVIMQNKGGTVTPSDSSSDSPSDSPSDNSDSPSVS